MGNELFALCALIIGLGLMGVLLRRNLMKIIIALSIIDTGLNMFIITRGYVAGCTAPILEGSRELGCFVDPIPQALTLTSIVIGASVTALALSLAIGIYRSKGTLEISFMEK